MNVTTERQDGILSARVTGRIDAVNVRELEETIRTAIEDGDRALILDFEKLVYISSTGLRAGSVAKSGYLVTCLRDLPRGVEA